MVKHKILIIPILLTLISSCKSTSNLKEEKPFKLDAFDEGRYLLDTLFLEGDIYCYNETPGKIEGEPPLHEFVLLTEQMQRKVGKDTSIGFYKALELGGLVIDYSILIEGAMTDSALGQLLWKESKCMQRLSNRHYNLYRDHGDFDASPLERQACIIRNVSVRAKVFFSRPEALNEGIIPYIGGIRPTGYWKVCNPICN